MRPYIICHMMASLDGRIDCDMTEKISGDEYYEALEALGCPNELNGRVTAKMHYALPEPFTDGDSAPIGRSCWAVNRQSDKYHIILDTHGSLRYAEYSIYGTPALVVMSEAAPRSYADYLDGKGISWIAVGSEGIELQRAMSILHDEFGVLRLAVTGGGNINGAFLKAGLLDEVSMQFAPGIDGRKGLTAAFDGIEDQDFGPVNLTLLSVKQHGNGTVWMRYRV